MTDLNDPLSDEMEVLNVLLNEGIEQRYLTYDQILEALPEIENNITLLETLLEEAQTLGIAIYENEDDVVAVALGAPDDEPDDGLIEIEIAEEVLYRRPAHAPSHDAPLFDLSNVPIDDSVGLYFREMGQQQLLWPRKRCNWRWRSKPGGRLRSGWPRTTLPTSTKLTVW